MADADQSDGVVESVVPHPITRRHGQQTLVVVVADGPGGHADQIREFLDSHALSEHRDVASQASRIQSVMGLAGNLWRGGSVSSR